MKKIIVLIALSGISFGAGAASFPGSNTGAIPDAAGGGPQNWGAPRDVTFNVSGITPPIDSIGLSMTISHTFFGDLDSVLIAPDATQHVIFRSVLMCNVAAQCPNAGGSNQSVSGFVLKFSNFVPGAGTTPATNPWSGPLVNNTNYVTTTEGASAAPPGTPTDFRVALAGIADPNGTWTLRFRDGWNADTGTVSAATLFIDEAVPGLPVELQEFSID